MRRSWHDLERLGERWTLTCWSSLAGAAIILATRPKMSDPYLQWSLFTNQAGPPRSGDAPSSTNGSYATHTRGIAKNEIRRLVTRCTFVMAPESGSRCTTSCLTPWTAVVSTDKGPTWERTAYPNRLPPFFMAKPPVTEGRENRACVVYNIETVM